MRAKLRHTRANRTAQCRTGGSCRPRSVQITSLITISKLYHKEVKPSLAAAASDLRCSGMVCLPSAVGSSRQDTPKLHRCTHNIIIIIFIIYIIIIMIIIYIIGDPPGFFGGIHWLLSAFDVLAEPSVGERSHSVFCFYRVQNGCHGIARTSRSIHFQCFLIVGEWTFVIVHFLEILDAKL